LFNHRSKTLRTPGKEDVKLVHHLPVILGMVRAIRETIWSWPGLPKIAQAEAGGLRTVSK